MTRRTDKRRSVIPLAIAATALGGALLSVWLSREAPEQTRQASAAGAHEFLDDGQARRAHQSFQQGVAML